MPKVNFPTAKHRFFHGAYVIFWRWKGTQYQVSTGLNREKEDKPAANILKNRFCVALQHEIPDLSQLPSEYARKPGMTRYITDRIKERATGQTAKEARADGEIPAEDTDHEKISLHWLDDYEPHLRTEVDESWADPSMSMLRRLDQYVRGPKAPPEALGIELTTPALAQNFLVSLMKKDGLSPATRNRALIQANRFFKWAKRTKRLTGENPFDGIKLLAEERPVDILYCTKEEREAIIGLAREYAAEDYLAVMIAFLAGLRMSEIYRLEWRDIDFETDVLIIRKSKTKIGRKVTMHPRLRTEFETWPENKRQGVLFQLFRMRHHESQTPAKRIKNHCKRVIEKLQAHAKRIDIPIASIQHIGWNAWRHTFGSLLVQGGATLDETAAIMGNTSEVCKRHYANFVRRDQRNQHIDNL